MKICMTMIYLKMIQGKTGEGVERQGREGKDNQESVSRKGLGKLWLHLKGSSGDIPKSCPDKVQGAFIVPHSLLAKG